MPSVDAVARESEVFRRCYAHSSHSNYSDTVPLSSQYPLRSWDMHYYPAEPPYPRVLLHHLMRGIGYRTAIVSSQDERWGGMENFFDVASLDYYFHAGTADSVRETTGSMPKYRQWMTRAERSGKVDDKHTISALIDWIGKTPQKPFAAYVNLQSSHFPYWTPGDFARQFDPPKGKEVPRARQRYFNYLNSLAYIDQQLARLFKHLREQEMWERTVIVISADTATRFLFVDRGGHGDIWQVGNGTHLFEDVLRVPMVLRIPGRASGMREEVCQHLDVLPSLVEAVGLPPHPSFQGVSMLPANYLAGRPVFHVAQSPLAHEYSVIDDDWQLVYDDTTQTYRVGPLDGSTPTDLERDTRFEKMAVELSTWMTEQVKYYANPVRQATHYPPKPP